MFIMRILSFRLLSLLLMFSQLSAERLSDDWEYRQGDLGGPYEALRTDPLHNLGMEWQAVSLPHCFNETDAVAPEVRYYQGPGWYRKKLQIENPYKDGRTFLRFDGAGQKTKVYVEDTFISEHVGGYDEFQFEITDAVRKHSDHEGKVTLLVRCDNSRDLQMIPSNLSDFNLYGGLYRPVHLLYRPAVSFSWPVIDVSVDEDGSKGEIRFQMEAMSPSGQKGELKVSLTVEDPNGKIVAKEQATHSLSSKKMTSLGASVSQALLWSPDDPNLYRWKLTSQAPDGEVHIQQGTLGFRHFRFEKKGPFFLNGKRLLLRGTHRHEDHAGVGAAMTDAQMRSEMEMMKSMGVNFIRLGHYQQSRTILELCNELGILVWEEIPWCRGGLGGDTFKEQARRMLRNMIAQHRHHPSIILWGLGNENDWPGDFEEAFGEVEIAAIRAFMKELHDLSHKLDPSRLTAIRRCDFCADIVDVYSPSIWAGWYRGIYRDYKEVSRQRMEKVNHFLHVEWGADHHTGRHSEDPYAGIGLVNPGDADERAGDFLQDGGEARVSKDGDWSETYACDLIDWHLKEQETMPWLTGTAYWPFKDFSTPIRPENPVPFMNQKGVVQRDLTPKESFYVFQSYWTTDPMIRIYGHSWPVRWGEKNEPKVVKVYANCESVELFLNGKSLGSRQRDSQNFPAAGLRWITPFQKGINTLRAVGKMGDSVVEDQLEFEYQTETWAAPAKLDFKVIAETKETATVQVYALDAKGVRCPDARNYVHFDLTGDGRLVADLGTPTTARKVQLANGRAEISLEKNNGESVVSVRSDGMATQFLSFK
jgi:beta-galactosidase